MSDVSPAPDEASDEYSQEQVDLNLAELEDDDDLSSSMRGKTVRKKLTAAAENDGDDEKDGDKEDCDNDENVSPEKGKSALRDMLGGGVVPGKVEEEIKEDTESELGEVIDSFDDDDGCDAEPILKFEPLVAELAAVLGKDTVSSLAREDTASDRLFVDILSLRPRRPPPRPQHRPPSRPARPAVSQPGEG